MPENDKFFSVNIREYLALGNDEEAGEPALAELLSGFSCPKNPDVERLFEKECHRVYQKESVCYIYCSFSRECQITWIFYPCIKTIDGKGGVKQ